MNDWKQCSRQSKNTIKMICNIKWNDVATKTTEKRKLCQQWGFGFYQRADNDIFSTGECYRITDDRQR